MNGDKTISARQRLAWFVLLTSCTVFTNGCEKGQAYFTFGFLLPYLEFSDKPSLEWWSPTLLLAQAALFVVLWRRWQRTNWRPAAALFRIVDSGRCLAATTCVVLVFNSYFFYDERIWTNAVFWPTLHVANFLKWLTGVESRWTFFFGARIYFGACLVVVYGVVWALARLARRYLFVTPERWWQFRLGGLWVLMVVLGTSIGLLVRWLQRIP